MLNNANFGLDLYEEIEVFMRFSEKMAKEIAKALFSSHFYSKDHKKMGFFIEI